MFEKDYYFRGKHAQMVLQLTNKQSSDIKALFNSNADVYKVAPIVGFMYQRMAPIDTSSDDKTKIPDNMMFKIRKVCLYNYRLIMMAYEKNTSSLEERVERAFKLDEKDEERKYYDEIFDNYVRGGVEVLYEKILSDTQNINDVIKNISEFLYSYNDRYYEKDSNEDDTIASGRHYE